MLVGADEAKMEKLRDAMLDMIRGWNQHEVAGIVRETLDEVVTPIIFGEALDLIDEHQTAGRLVVIVSSAPEEVVRPLGEFLGVDDVIATRADVDERRQLHRRARVLRLRPAQGRRDPRARGTRRSRPRRRRTPTATR